MFWQIKFGEIASIHQTLVTPNFRHLQYMNITHDVAVMYSVISEFINAFW